MRRQAQGQAAGCIPDEISDYVKAFRRKMTSAGPYDQTVKRHIITAGKWALDLKRKEQEQRLVTEGLLGVCNPLVQASA